MDRTARKGHPTIGHVMPILVVASIVAGCVASGPAQKSARMEVQEEVRFVITEEARISNALDQRGILNVAVAEQPVVPALPVRSPIREAGLTFLLGFFISLGTGFVVDYASPSFRTPDEVEGYLDVPVLGSLPKGKA